MIYLTGGGASKEMLTRLRKHDGLGILAGPTTNQNAKVRYMGKPWAADNGCFKTGDKFRMEDYLRWLGTVRDMSHLCLFATAPDVVGDAKATWERSLPTFQPIRDAGFKPALVAQDGIDKWIDWDLFDALFLGGTTEWKLSTEAAHICHEAKRREKWLHVGRVNSWRRLKICADFKADSVDGNMLAFEPDVALDSITRWLQYHHQQPTLGMEWDTEEDTGMASKYTEWWEREMKKNGGINAFLKDLRKQKKMHFGVLGIDKIAKRKSWYGRVVLDCNGVAGGDINAHTRALKNVLPRYLKKGEKISLTMAKDGILVTAEILSTP